MLQTKFHSNSVFNNDAHIIIGTAKRSLLEQTMITKEFNPLSFNSYSSIQFKWTVSWSNYGRSKKQTIKNTYFCFIYLF